MWPGNRKKNKQTKKKTKNKIEHEQYCCVLYVGNIFKKKEKKEKRNNGLIEFNKEFTFIVYPLTFF